MQTIKHTISRSREGVNNRSNFGNWFHPLYPSSIDDFIPRLKLRNKQTSIIFPEFWEIMLQLITEENVKSLPSFLDTIMSIVTLANSEYSDTGFPVKYEKPNQRKRTLSEREYKNPLFLFVSPDGEKLQDFVAYAIEQKNKNTSILSLRPYKLFAQKFIINA